MSKRRAKALLLTTSVLTLSAHAAWAQAPATPPPPIASGVEEIIVTGSRLQASGFTTPTPVTVIGSEALETRGAISAVEATSDIQMFQNSTGQSRGTGGTFAGGQGLLDLRGLGANRTLVLVDGRRHVPTNTNGTWDTNQLPSALVEQVDVVTGGASAAYGSDAVAGVVNFVINDRLQGVKGAIQYGVSEEGDAEQKLINLAAGTEFAGGRGRVVIGGDYLNGDPSGTLYSRDWGARETYLVPLAANRPAGLPAFLKADNVHMAIPYSSLVTSCQRPGPGGALVAVTPCPIAGLTFSDGGAPRPFQFGDPRGTTQMVGGEGSIQPRNQFLATGAERWGALGRVTYDFTDNVTGWAEFSAGRFEYANATVDYLNAGNIVIQRDNPFLPAALAAQMDAGGITRFNLARRNYEAQGGLQATNINRFWQGSFGLRGAIFDDWNWDAYYSKGRSHFFYKPNGLTALPEYFRALYVVRDSSGNPTCGPLASNPMYQALSPAQRALYTANVTEGCVPFNPFGPRAESQAAIDYVAPDVVSDTAYDQQAAGVNLTGNPFSTWAGDVLVAVGAEWRKDSVETTLSALNTARSTNSLFFAANPQPGAGGQSVKEGYVEAGVPLARDAAFASSLDLNGAVRVTDYSIAGSVTTWKLGGTWDVNDDLRFRVTRSRDIRAPNVAELFYRGNDGFSFATNPLTGRSNQINSAAVNNLGLQPEKADTWTVGFVLRPGWEWARGFQASVDYYAISLDGVVGTLGAPNIINGYFLQNRQDYAQFITFDPSAPAGFVRVDSPQLNLNSLETEGLDVNIAYRTPEGLLPFPGTVGVNFVGTMLMKHKTYGPDGSVISNDGFTRPNYRWVTNVNYRQDRFSTTITARYQSSFHGSFTLIGPDDPNYSPSNPRSVTDNLWPDMVYFSLQGEYAIREVGSQRLVVYGIVDNLLDASPPAGGYTILEGLGSGMNSLGNGYDFLGRYFKVGLRFNF